MNIMNKGLISAQRRIVAIARKELRQLSRDQLTLGFVVGVPIVQLLLFGYAINQDVRNVTSVVVDHSHSAVSRRVIGRLAATQTFRMAERLATENEARHWLEQGKAEVAIIVPEDFARRFYRGRGAEILILVNATDPVLARAVRASAGGLAERLDDALQPFIVDGRIESLRAARERGTFFAKPDLIHERHMEFTVLNLYNPELRTAIFVVPGLLGVILTTTMILMTAVAIVRERERGTFELLIATPVRRVELMLGKILPYIGIGALQIVLVLLIGVTLVSCPLQRLSS